MCSSLGASLSLSHCDLVESNQQIVHQNSLADFLSLEKLGTQISFIEKKIVFQLGRFPHSLPVYLSLEMTKSSQRHETKQQFAYRLLKVCIIISLIKWKKGRLYDGDEETKI